MAGCQGREVKFLRCPAAVKGTKARKTNATVVGNTIMGRRVSRKPKAGRPIQNKISRTKNIPREEKMKKLIIGILFLYAFCFLPVISLFAEEQTLEEIVVTATRYEEKTSIVPASVTVISEEDIQQSTAQTIPDILRMEVGIHVNDITGNRRTFTVDLRGFGETASFNTLVLVDGRKVNEPDLSGVDWTVIPLERVKRIEIIRGGSGSVLYGDNAAGGVINIITKEGDTLKGGAEIASGSYGTFKSDAYASGNLDNLSFYLSGRYFTSDGYRENSDTEAKDFGVNLNYNAADLVKLYISGGYHKDNTGLPGALKESDFAAGISRTDSTHPDDFADVEDYYVQAIPAIHFPAGSIAKIDMSFRKRNWVSFATGDWGSFTGNSEIKTIIFSPQILIKNSIGKVKNSLILGIDYRNADDDIVNESLFFGSEMFDLKKDDYGYYFHDEVNIADSLYVSGGYRHDRAEFTFRPSKPKSVGMHGDAYTAGVNYVFFKKSYVYCNFSRSFRYPLFDEVFSYYTNTIDADLIPQTADDYEVGGRYYFSDRAYAHLNVFRINTWDEIFYNPKAFRNENLGGKTRRDGMEVSVNAEVSKWLTVRGGYSYLNAKIKGGEFKGNYVPDVPKHKAIVEAVSSLGRGFSFMVNGVYVGRRPFVSDFKNAFSDQSSFFVLNGKIMYQWKALKAFLDINNITNKEFSEYGVIGGFPIEKSFYPSPERNFLVGLSIEL
jgi:iron complex outermembrane receptor protein